MNETKIHASGRFSVVRYPDGFAVIDAQSNPLGNIVMHTATRQKAHAAAKRYNADPANAPTERYSKGS